MLATFPWREEEARGGRPQVLLDLGMIMSCAFKKPVNSLTHSYTPAYNRGLKLPHIILVFLLCYLF